MMQGIVDQNCEAMIRLVVGNSRDRRIAIDALIDTGFTGFLTLPKSIVTHLGLSAYSREEGTLGDGSCCIFDIYSGVVIGECDASFTTLLIAKALTLWGIWRRFIRR
jgi:clan AA aspartic protease